MNRSSLFAGLFALSTLGVGCTPGTELDQESLQGADESVDSEAALTGSVPVGSTLKTTADLNLRKGPSTSKAVMYTMPEGSTVTVESAAPSNGFYKVKHNGTIGFAYGAYLQLVSAPDDDADVPDEDGTDEPPPPPSSKRAQAIARAKKTVGFSYWWGHGRFAESGATASNKGKCTGSCPNCSHSGSYGGDCSGMAAKVWQVPSSNTSMSVDSHPYSTADFDDDTSQWFTVSRANLKQADAMVYRSGGAGHIFIYGSGDGWGSMYAYECKGCSAGCIEGYRTASSAYHGIRRTGY
jgi:hypothetical protein